MALTSAHPAGRSLRDPGEHEAFAGVRGGAVGGGGGPAGEGGRVQDHGGK